MENGTSKCTNVITDLQKACKSSLNPNFYTKNIQVLAGTQLQSSRIPIQLGDLYSLTANSDNTIISYATKALPLADPTFSSANGDCTCSGFIREMKLNVFLKQTSNYYQITDVFADFVTQD